MNYKITPEIRQYILGERQRGTPNKDIPRRVYRKFKVRVTAAHCCKLANDAGLRMMPRIRKPSQPCYERPPFNHRKPMRVMEKCRHMAYESLKFAGYCWHCELRGIPQARMREMASV